MGNFKRCNCKDDLVELEAVKSLLQSFRTAEEALAAAEVPNDKKSYFQGIQTDKTIHLSIKSHIHSTVSYRPGSFMQCNITFCHIVCGF